MSSDLDPDVQDLLKEFLEEKRSEKAKGYTLENLANAFLKHKDEDAKWKSEALRTVNSRFESIEARQRRHVRRIEAVEKSKPTVRSPDDTGHEFVLDPPDDRGWLRRSLREKALTIIVTAVLLLISTGAVVLIQRAAHATPMPQLESHP
jgi:hypothetical protein